MKRLILSIATTVMLALLASSAMSAIYTFVPSPEDLWGLDHNYYYSWGIEWNHPGEHIVDAVLTFNDIYDWRVEYGDSLYMHLLDDPAVGTFAGYEGYTNGDYFDGQGTLIDVWSDPNGGVSNGTTLSYRFSDLGLVGTLNDYASNGVFGFGFDPDCHYFNSGVELKVITAVPEPSTILLIGMGLIGAGLIHRRKSA
ncbi:MAG: PEP-CTERM sorting domain-containing protein [Candidatus Zixiibacteriota bacterium]